MLRPFPPHSVRYISHCEQFPIKPQTTNHIPQTQQPQPAHPTSTTQKICAAHSSSLPACSSRIAVVESTAIAYGVVHESVCLYEEA